MSGIVRRLAVTLVIAFALVALPTFPDIVGPQAAALAEAKGAKTVRVRSYTKKNGTRVNSHRRSSPGRGPTPRKFSAF